VSSTQLTPHFANVTSVGQKLRSITLGKQIINNCISYECEGLDPWKVYDYMHRGNGKSDMYPLALTETNVLLYQNTIADRAVTFLDLLTMRTQAVNAMAGLTPGKEVVMGWVPQMDLNGYHPDKHFFN